MVDKKACKIKKKRKYKINGAVFATRLTIFLVILGIAVTIYSTLNKGVPGKILESSAYVDEEGISSMVKGVKDGGVYTSDVTPTVTSSVKKATLTRDGEEVKFVSGKKISKMGSYILILEDGEGNTDTIYFDIEYKYQ